MKKKLWQHEKYQNTRTYVQAYLHPLIQSQAKLTIKIFAKILATVQK